MSTGNEKVMLVEDDATMLTVLRTLLEIENFRVAVAPDKKTEAEIVESIRQEAPDVILMDVYLRQANGLKIMRMLRADPDPQLKDVRVVMSSGMPVKEECLAAGANSFLLKPFMPDELIQMLRPE